MAEPVTWRVRALELGPIDPAAENETVLPADWEPFGVALVANVWVVHLRQRVGP
jgi:hypothetical protein